RISGSRRARFTTRGSARRRPPAASISGRMRPTIPASGTWAFSTTASTVPTTSSKAACSEADDRDAPPAVQMKIATWNVNGVRARQGDLLTWLAEERPDVACLQEIKASIDQLPFDLRDVDGYWSIWHGEKGYSGVAILVS